MSNFKQLLHPHLERLTAAQEGTAGELRLGLRVNLVQFSLLASITFGVGLVVGAERVVVPVLARQDFDVASYLAVLSFIVSFGFVKAVLNLVAGRLSDQVGRKLLLVIGWLVALPIPFMIIFAPSWGWIVAANLLLGVNQGLAWSMTVTSKIDLVGPLNRGFATGINEFSGYAGVSVGGLLGGLLGGIYGLRVAPFIFVLAVVVVMLGVSLILVRETLPYTRSESQKPTDTKFIDASRNVQEQVQHKPSLIAIVALTTWRDKALAAASQAGLIEKFTDTLA
jgi:MFS family permease